MKTITFIYSSESVKAIKRLFTGLRWVFGYTLIPEFDDMFYYGVFCKSVTYANFSRWKEGESEGVEVPEILTAICYKQYEKEDFVKRIIIEK